MKTPSYAEEHQIRIDRSLTVPLTNEMEHYNDEWLE